MAASNSTPIYTTLTDVTLSTAIPTISLSPRRTGPITLSASRASLRQKCAGTQQDRGPGELDAIIDCVGAPEMMQLGFGLLSISGHYADVGLVGDRIDIPLCPRVSREQTLLVSMLLRDLLGRTPPPSVVLHRPGVRVRASPRVVRSLGVRGPELHPDLLGPRPASTGSSAAFHS